MLSTLLRDVCHVVCMCTGCTPGSWPCGCFSRAPHCDFFPPYCPNPPYHCVWDSEEESNFFDLVVLHRETIEHR